MSVFGAPVELVWLPRRKARAGAPRADRPPFQPDRASQILATESVWSGHGCALTPNRWPLGDREVLLWATEPVREWPLALLEVALALEERDRVTVLGNTIGAAASIPRAHLHLIDGELPFLAELAREPWTADAAQGIEDVELSRLAPPFPVLAVGLRGPAAARARATHTLIRRRLCASFNIISQNGETWLVPRRGPEIPAPHFPFALGAAELWGRWCYGDRAPFDAATGAALEGAVRESGFPLDGAP